MSTTVARSGRGGTVLLVLALVVVLVAGALALVAARDRRSPAGVGEVVEFDGGSLRVDSVVDVDLSAPMAGPGMAMGPSSGVPDIPEGMRWVTLDVTLAAPADAALRIDPDAFVVVGAGGPVALDDGGTLVPPGGAMERAFTYEVPAGSTSMDLRAPGTEDVVRLVLGPAPSEHGH